jgi:tRNA dimethylallyltransferase
LDLIKPDQDFSVAQWVEFAKIVIADIQARGKLAIVVGGTGFWIKALLTGIEWGRVPPDWELRKELENLSVEKLQQRLQQHAEKFWKEMTPSDWQNPRRLMRRIEVAEFLQDHTEEEATLTALDEGIIQEKIYLDFPLKRVNQNITKRVKKRLKQGLAAEIKQLLENGYSFTDPGLNTLGYKQFAGYFKGEKQLDQVVAEWKKDEQDYARRQQVWFDKYFNTKLD